MPGERRPSTFRQRDLTRALRAAKAAGLDVTGYEVDPETGKITVRTAGHTEMEPVGNPLDEWLKTHAG
jgi:hypothetical protein